MKPYVNKNEALSSIAEFLKTSPCYFSFKSNVYKKDISVAILASSLYLGQFNRIVTTKTSSTFSYLANDEIIEYKKRILKSLDKSMLDSNQIHVSDNSKEVNLSGETKIAIKAEFLQSIFSATFIEQNKLSPDEIESEIEISRSLQEDAIREGEPVSHLRWEEVRDDLRVILSMSPVDGSVQLSYCSLCNAYKREKVLQNYNAVTAHFEDQFSYDGSRFDRFSSRHDVKFLEVQGYEKHPENDLNEQLFEIKFNVIAEGTFDEIAQKSFRSLKRETKQIISQLHLIYAHDIYGNTSAELPIVDLNNAQSELQELMKGILGSALKNNHAVIGKLHYHSPENDIHITYSPSFETDDSENQFIVFFVRIKIVPFNSNPPEITGTYYHPVVYDAGK